MEFSPAVFPVTAEDVQRAILNIIRPINKRDADMSAKEVAVIWDLPCSTADKELRDARVLAHHFIQLALERAKIGDLTLCQMIVPDGYELAPLEGGAVNGCVDDELGELMVDGGGVKEALAKGDTVAARKHYEEGKRDWARVGKEIEVAERRKKR